MKNGQCPNCGGKNIFTGSNVFQQEMSQMPLGGMLDGVRAFTFDDYVCADCGAYQRFISDAEVLNLIPQMAMKGKRWKKVSARA